MEKAHSSGLRQRLAGNLGKGCHSERERGISLLTTRSEILRFAQDDRILGSSDRHYAGANGKALPVRSGGSFGKSV